MNDLVLKVDKSKKSFSEALGISDERLDELLEMVNEIQNRDNLNIINLSELLEEISFLDITVEEYTLLVYMIGKTNK